ncbi:MAG TPA: protocatechuate 3,4-dioxygenase, partial [Candidatus Binatia bacterium]|nr:protocatechuate 3,4-dioxygenase [Candidatus Binatia bacterium]
DVSTSERLPLVNGEPHGIPHAFGFLYRRIMEDNPPPSVPLFTNIGCEPNIVRAKRCVQLGHAMKKAIDRLPDGLRVATISSGGFSHFTIDEEFDREVMDAMTRGDETKLASIPEPYFWGNTCETKSWFPNVALMNDLGRKLHMVDYVPCYRSVAGTGQAMAFGYWD